MHWRILFSCTTTLLLSACSNPQGLKPSATADQPWQATSSVWSLQQDSAGQASQSFSVPAIPQLNSINVPVDDLSQPLSLAQLIDLAQRHNPSTQLAWNHAREAALSVGLTDALFLPALSASVIAGEQRLKVPVELPLNLGKVDVENTIRGITPFATLTWLLFDFGGRDAVRNSAQYAALAANVLFNASHQKVIRDVSDAYYRYSAARHNVTLAERSLEQHQQVLTAIEARFANGLATRVDQALAEQGVAQGRLNLVTHQGFERTSYLALTEAMGLPAHTQLYINTADSKDLPRAHEPLTQQKLEALIAQRPDIAAAFAAVKAAESGKRSAVAAYLPKVYFAAGVAANHSNLHLGNLGTDSQNTASGFLLGMTMPLYDGGLRRTQLKKAELAQESAQQRLSQLQLTAIREIISLEQGLTTALQAHDAANELVRTTQVTYDAAFAAYKVGRASSVLLTEAALQLNKAQQAKADAQYSALAGAVNLAFAMGSLTSAQALAEWP